MPLRTVGSTLLRNLYFPVNLVKLEECNLDERIFLQFWLVRVKYMSHQGSGCQGTSSEIENTLPMQATALATEARTHFPLFNAVAYLLTVAAAGPSDSSKASLPKLEEKVPTRMLHLMTVKQEDRRWGQESNNEPT